MIDSSVARRYARALLALGLEEGRHEKFGDELDAVVRALDESQEARDMALNPGYSAQQRQGVVGTLASQLQLSPTVVNFLRLLVERQRLPGLPQIARAFRELVDAQVGRVRAVVTSAQPLSPDELSRIQSTLASATRKSIALEAKTDPSIIGGVVTQVGATLFDGSLKTQLERLREELKRAPV